MEWLSDIFQNYWPSLFIILGLVVLIRGYVELEVAWGIFGFIIFVGLGVFFFLYNPRDIWQLVARNGEEIFSWLLVHLEEPGSWLVHGAWYEITLKIGGVIGILGIVVTIIKFFMATGDQDAIALILFFLLILVIILLILSVLVGTGLLSSKKPDLVAATPSFLLMDEL